LQVSFIISLPQCFSQINDVLINKGSGGGNIIEKLETYKSADIVSAIKSRRLRWAGHVLRREE
jgi:hypothetical protein